ncbi:MAG: cell wall hydrolase [Pseudomonadota bacterium]
MLFAKSFRSAHKRFCQRKALLSLALLIVAILPFAIYSNLSFANNMRNVTFNTTVSIGDQTYESGQTYSLRVVGETPTHYRVRTAFWGTVYRVPKSICTVSGGGGNNGVANQAAAIVDAVQLGQGQYPVEGVDVNDTQFGRGRNVTCSSGMSNFDCLVCNCFFESRGESDRGKRAIAKNTISRQRSDAYPLHGGPNTMCGIVWDHRQYSWTQDGKSDLIEAGEDGLSDCMTQTVNGIAEMENLWMWKLMFHNPTVNPDWGTCYGRERIDDHIFYDYCRP